LAPGQNNLLAEFALERLSGLMVEDQVGSKPARADKLLVAPLAVQQLPVPVVGGLVVADVGVTAELLLANAAVVGRFPEVTRKVVNLEFVFAAECLLALGATERGFLSDAGAGHFRFDGHFVCCQGYKNFCFFVTGTTYWKGYSI